MFASLFLLIFYSCTPALQLTKATSQYWCVNEKKINGVNHHILLKTNVSYSELTFDSLKCNKTLIKDYNYSVIGKSINEQRFNKNDTVIISFNRIGVAKAEPITIYFSLNHHQKCINVNNFSLLKPLCP